MLLMRISTLLPALSLVPLALASCGSTGNVDNSAAASTPDAPFVMQETGRAREPWAMAFAPGTNALFVTERAGTGRAIMPDGKAVSVSGVPAVDHGGQGGLGDIAFLPSQAAPTIGTRTIFLSWAEAGRGDTRGAAVGRGTLACEGERACAIRDLKVIWRQQPKVTGRGHYSHRLAISPDGRHLYIASGDRQKMEPAQDPASDLGKVIRVPLDVSGPPEQVSMGHRNILGLSFDEAGRLWALEHGPAGGDELNLVRKGGNYGWPLVSQGDHYDGRAIPRHPTRPDLAAPALSWNPVIAPGGMALYRGDMFPQWRGQALIAAMKPAAIVRVAFDGETAREVARYPMENRIRAIVEHADGSIWIAEDGKGLPESRILRLSPPRPKG